MSISDVSLQALTAAYRFFTAEYLKHVEADRMVLAKVYDDYRNGLSEIARELGLIVFNDFDGFLTETPENGNRTD